MTKQKWFFKRFTKFEEEEKILKKMKKMKCSVCDSKQGLIAHLKRKHTVINKQMYPRTCELFDTELKILKKWTCPHSYKESTFKCELCDYWCQTDMAMEVHNGKSHSGNLECGLCDFKAKIWKI